MSALTKARKGRGINAALGGLKLILLYGENRKVHHRPTTARFSASIVAALREYEWNKGS